MSSVIWLQAVMATTCFPTTQVRHSNPFISLNLIRNLMENKEYNPDVLNCIANLSNDEVFTPPALANQVLDMLPQELFRSPTTTFLDPFCKSGVFLREIVKRLDCALAPAIPNRQNRIDHTMHHHVYGIA